MRGVIKNLDKWDYGSCSALLEEAGLREIKGRPCIYGCGVEDAIEVIAVLESWEDVTVSNREYGWLAALMRRGHIGRASLMGWLKRCNRKPRRTRRPGDMPLFEREGADVAHGS